MEPQEFPGRATAPAGAGEPGCVTPDMLLYLRQTRPWIILIYVLGYIGSGLLMLAGLGFLIGGTVCVGEKCTLVPVWLSIVYLLAGLLYLIPITLLMKYASAIGRLLRGGDQVRMLEEALKRQRSFWRVVGILVLVGMVVYAGAFVGGFLVALMGK